MIDLFGLVGKISIHAPRTGSDCIMRSEAAKAAKFQSTLPARGATNLLDVFLMELDNFNPRSPHGERRRKPHAASHHARFQSTLPARGATRRCRPRCSARRNFNPRSPHGERQGALKPGSLVKQFQSTLPARGATISGLNSRMFEAISIHAPRTGSDEPHFSNRTRTHRFQSTLPARGATVCPCGKC